MDRKAHLVSLITEASKHYYDGSDPIITDDQFDSLVKELRSIDPDDQILCQIGWGHSPTGNISPHLIPLGDIQNKFSVLDQFKISETRIVTPKLDGLSVITYWYNGELLYALKRGNGSVGEVVTSKMKVVTSGNMVREQFPNEFVIIRGEVVIPNKFKSILDSRSIPNPRNYASGIMNRKEDTDLDLLNYIPYSIIGTNTNSLITTIEKYDCLRRLIDSFNIYLPMLIIDDSNRLDSILDEFLVKCREMYPCDGLVLTKSSIDRKIISSNPTYGHLLSYTEYSDAYKPETETANIVIKDVEWSVGSIGRVVPTGVYEPVFLSGAFLSRVTLFNHQYARDNNIGVGSVLKIKRSGEVIPYVVEVLSPSVFNSPTKCPICQSYLIYRGVDLVCTNRYCMSKVEEVIYRLFYVAGLPKGLGMTYIGKLIHMLNIKDPIEIKFWCVNLDRYKSTIIEELGDHYGSLVIKVLSNLFIKLESGLFRSEFWWIANLDGVGEEHSKSLPNPNEFLADTSILGTSVPVNVVESLYSSIDYIHNLLLVFPVSEVANVITSKSVKYKVAITGTLSKPRNELAKIYESYGVSVSDISKSTDYLICNSPSNHGKYRFAVSNGIKVISEDDFMLLLQ